MTATIANVDAALKNDYQPVIREQLRNKWILLSQIESSSKDVEGRYAVLSLHTGRSGGVGGRAAGAQLPDAGNQTYSEQRVSIVRNYARIGIHGDLIEASASDKGSFGRMLQAELDGAMTDVKNDVSRQVYNDSTTAIVQCGVTSAATTVVLTSPTAVQMRQLHVGMVIDIGTTTLFSDVADGVAITAVDRSAGTFDVAVAITTDANDYVFRGGAEGNELTGIREMVDSTGTYQNVDPTVVPDWKSVENTTGGVPTELLFETVIEDIHFESDEDVNLIMTSRGVRRGLASTLLSQKRFDSVDLKGGFKAVTVAAGNVEVPLVVDNDCPNNEAYFLNTNRICQHRMGKGWGFMERDGSVLKYVTNYDQYEAIIYQYHQLTTDRRNAHGKATGLTEA